MLALLRAQSAFARRATIVQCATMLVYQHFPACKVGIDVPQHAFNTVQMAGTHDAIPS